MNQKPTIISLFSINDTVLDMLAQLRWTLSLQIRNQHKLLFSSCFASRSTKAKKKSNYCEIKCKILCSYTIGLNWIFLNFILQ